VKITIEEWAKRTYQGVEITLNVLNKWRREGQIHPAPERVMRQWMVDPDAQRITHTSPRLVSQIRRASR
jgi:predicted site-specific integrase-resolvase